MIRALLRRLRDRQGEEGFTLVEVVASVVILGIIIVPLGMAMVFGFREVFDIQGRLANAADVQKLSTYFPSDVASVDSDGVNPLRLEDEGVCKATPSEQSLITFRWDKDLGDGGQTVVRYVARGTGTDSEVVRRICRGSDPPRETVLAQNFGQTGNTSAADYLTPDGTTKPTPICGTRLCYIQIHGAYDYRLEAQRRVEGDLDSRTAPGAPTNVHALGGYQRVRLFWDVPADTGGAPISGYYVWQKPPDGFVGGATTPTFFPANAGDPPGAVISGLTNFQSYQFQVRAVTVIGNGPWSDPSPEVTPGPTTPEPVSLDSAVGDPSVNTQVDATWSLPADYSDGGSAITGFRIRAINPDSTPTDATVMNPAARTGSVPGLQPNTKYTVQVTALNSLGPGSPSPSITNVLTLPGKPSAPTAAGTGTAGTVKLTFTPPTEGQFADLTNFRAKVGSTFTSPVDVATACPTSASCSLTVSGVSVSSSTTVNVQAQNATGWGALSDALTIPADTTAPTIAFSFPVNAQYGTAAWNAGCSNAGGAICGTASDAAPGAVSGVTMTIRRSSDNKYWDGSGTSSSDWSSSTQNLTASGTSSWGEPMPAGALTNTVTYTIVATAKDSVNHATSATKIFAYVTGAPTAALTAPASGANVQGTVAVTGNAGATSPATVASAEFQYKASSDSSWSSIAVDTATPYSTQWITTGLPDGSYDLREVVTDSAGNTTASSTRSVTVDNNPPSGSITAPTNGAYVRSSVTVSANSADAGSGVANAVFQYKATPAATWTQIGSPDTSSPYQVTWNTTSVPEGSYDLRVITTDNVGLTFTSPVISVLVDNTGPTIGSPVVTGTLGSNGWYTTDVNVTWPTPSDPAGIASTTGCGPTTITSDTTGTVLTCSATDNAGNTSSSSVTIKRDASPPSGSLTNPTNGDSVTGNVTVSSNSADTTSGIANATFQYSPAGANTWTTIGAPDTSSPYGVGWNTTPLADGNYDLRVVTTNNAGTASTSAIRTVFVDTTPPTVAFTFPVNGTIYNAAGWAAGCTTNDVCGTANDGFGTVAGVTVTVRRSSDNKYWNGSAGTGSSQWGTSSTNLSTNGTSAWNRVFTTSSIQTGVTYTLVATATDGVGLTGTATSAFGYNTTNPTGSITAPSASANVNGTIPVTSNSAATSPSTVAFATIQYKPSAGSTWTTIGAPDTTSPYGVSWDTTLLTDGNYDLRVITADSAGNTSTSSTVTVKVDNALPTGALTAPNDGAFVRGSSVTVSSNSADAGSGVASATFQRSPAGTNTWTTIGSDSASPYQTSWNTTSGTPDGDYDLRVVTTDNAGNSFTSPTRTVTVDNTAPVITPNVVGTLGANGWYTSNVALTWTVTDSSGIASSTGCGPSNVTANTTGTAFTCTATDNAGNSSNQPVTIKRDATTPTGSLTVPANGASVTGSVTVSSDSADTSPGSGVANATFQSSPAGANTWTTIGSPDTSSPYSVSWNTNPLADGNYDLRVITTDGAGLTVTSATRTVFVDSTAPTVAITFPADGSAYNAAGWAAGCATNDVCGTTNDGLGTVASVTLSVRRSSDSRYWNGSAGTGTSQWGTSATNLTVSGTTAWNRVLTTASLQTGVTYTMVATATDGVGQTGTTTNTFVYDTTNPTGTITAPANSANVTDSVTVSSNSADTGGAGVAAAVFEYRVATTGAWTPIGIDNTSPYSASWDTTAVPDGQYYLHVITTDNAGNVATSADTAVRVRVDNTLPTGAITAPTSGAYVKGTTVAVSSNSADTGAGVANATFQRSPAGANTWTTIGSADTSSPYGVTWSTTTLTDGSYDLRVITTDNVGNAFTSPVVTVKVDNTAPSVVANTTGTVGSNGWYTTNVGLTWTVTDTFSPLTLTNCGPQSVTADTASFSFTCTATDPAGNSSNGTFSGKRDATNPTGALTAPSDGATVHGTSVTVSSNSADATSGVASAALQRSPAGTNTWTTIATDTASPYTTSWNTTGVSGGDYDLRVVTTDNAGNTFTSPTVTVTVDNTKPSPTSVVLGDGGGAGNGKAEAGDTVTIVYSEPIKVSTLCTGWSGDGSNQSTNVTATLTNSSSSDVLTLPSPCSNIGPIDTNRDYVSSTRTFSNTSVAWNASTKTLTITLGTPSGTTNSGIAAIAPDYTPTANITDLVGNTMNATAFPGTSSRF